MTKTQYITEHPKSYLAHNLANNNWTDNCQIEIVGGLDAPYTKQSNLYAATDGGKKAYCIGGHRYRGTEGWWFAVKMN